MRELSRNELILLWTMTCVIFIVIVARFTGYKAKVDDFGDNGNYIAAADGIRHCDFRSIHVKQFWGVSYVMAAVSFLCAGSQLVALILVCCVSSLVAVLLARELWGGWIAAFFAILNFDWLQRSFLGGSEPLFVALLFASFYFMRRQQWVLAAMLAAFATVTRPIGVFALIAMGIVLLIKREYRRLVISTAVALAIGLLYILPFWIYFRDPLYQVHTYKTNDWQSGSPIGVPVYAIAQSFLHNQQPWTNLLLDMGWVIFVLVGAAAMFRRSFREYAHEQPPEALFAALYIAFIFSYNSKFWARAEFVRFAIPALPFVLLALRDWIPRSRLLVFGLGTVCAALAACSAIGIRNVFPMLR